MKNVPNKMDIGLFNSDDDDDDDDDIEKDWLINDTNVYV